MPEPETPLEELIALAAEMRVAGEKWQTVASAVKRGLTTVQRWPKCHPEPWKKYYAKAEALLMKDAASEALHTLRKLLRSESETVQQHAAQKLLQLRDARKKPARPSDGSGGSPIAEVRQLVDFLEALNHDQFHDYFGDPEPPAPADEPAPAPRGDRASPALAQ